MRRAAVTALLLACASAVVPSTAPAKVRKGPAGLRFYTPPKKQPKGPHGTLIWARGQKGPDALTSASKNELLLYRSTSVSGKRIAVSGSLALPKGKAPKGGWPVITFAHGTTGIADSCAPTRANGKDAVSGYTTYILPLLNRWLKAGWAVARTDYEGLGTPGAHPYLVGRSEGRSTLDVVRAARHYSGKLGKRLIVSGHSQGGHAALWAADLAPSWTPELKLRGTVAFAPASHLETQGRVLPSFTSSAFSGLAALIVRGVDAGFPALNVKNVLSTKGRMLYPQTLTRCLPDLGKPDSFGGITPKDLFRSGANLEPLLAKIGQSDPEHLTFHSPLLIEQGLGDSTVFPQFTDETVKDYEDHGMKPVYHTYKGVTHSGVVVTAATDATKYIRKRLR